MISSTHTGFMPARARGAAGRPRRPFVEVLSVSRALRAVHRWQWRRRTLRALDQLEDHMLKDIGLSRSTILDAIDAQEHPTQRGWF